jgi:hypothetical protein
MYDMPYASRLICYTSFAHLDDMNTIYPVTLLTMYAIQMSYEINHSIQKGQAYNEGETCIQIIKSSIFQVKL